MKCKSCKREIPDESIFCLHCGEKVVRNRSKKKELSVPKPRQLPSGTWFGRVMIDGERVSVSAETDKEYYAKAKAIKAGLLEANKSKSGITLKSAIREYIDESENILSPSTIRGYEIIYRNRFSDYMDKDIKTINYQAMLNDESKKVSEKTVINAWALVSPALKNAGIVVPNVRKPSVPESDEDWLDYEQIKVFLNAIKGNPAEAAALLALHGLRTSEFIDLDVSQIDDDGIHIRGATVPNKDHKLVHKETNKNKMSRRTVPVIIPRLLEILPPDGKAVTLHPSSIRRWIEKACVNANLPVCSPHDLRRSFASLAFHLKWDAQTTMFLGGWSNMQTVNAVYRKLSELDKNADVQRMKLFYAENGNEIGNEK